MSGKCYDSVWFDRIFIYDKLMKSFQSTYLLKILGGLNSNEG